MRTPRNPGEARADRSRLLAVALGTVAGLALIVALLPSASAFHSGMPIDVTPSTVTSLDGDFELRYRDRPASDLPDTSNPFDINDEVSEWANRQRPFLADRIVVQASQDDVSLDFDRAVAPAGWQIQSSLPDDELVLTSTQTPSVENIPSRLVVSLDPASSPDPDADRASVTFTVTAARTVGNFKLPHEETARVTLDGAAPRTTHTVDAETDTIGRDLAPARVALQATDGSGVDETRYFLLRDGTLEVDFGLYQGPFQLQEPGTYELLYASQDTLGNIEPFRSTEFTLNERAAERLELTAPRTLLTGQTFDAWVQVLDPDGEPHRSAEPTVTLRASRGDVEGLPRTATLSRGETVFTGLRTDTPGDVVLVASGDGLPNSTARVVVHEVPHTTIEIANDPVLAVAGGRSKVAFHVDAKDPFGNPLDVDADDVAWEITPSAGGSFEGNVLHLGQTAGRYNVTATDTRRNLSDTVPLIVEPGAAAVVRIDADGARSVEVGDRVSLSVTVEDAFGNEVPVPDVTWSVEGRIGRTVPSVGAVTTFVARDAGSGLVEVRTASGLSDSVPVNVRRPRHVTPLDGQTESVAAGETVPGFGAWAGVVAAGAALVLLRTRR